MVFGIVGLGLIGGSLARSIKFHSDHTVYGTDINETALLQARMVNAIDGELTEEAIARCEVILLCVYPRGTVEWLRGHGPGIAAGRTSC